MHRSALSTGLRLRPRTEGTEKRLWETLSNASDFWIASWTKALAHINNEEWKAAAKCFEAAIKHATAKQDPVLCYEAACAFLKANRQDDAKEVLSGYLDCLERASGKSAPPSADAVCLVDSRLSAVDWVDDAVARAYLEILANAARDRWGETAYSSYLLGFVLLNEDDTERAPGHFVRAISLDRTFWLAALAAARIYTAEDNWKSAAGWFRRALQTEGARLYADVWFEAAWCFGRAKSRDEEIDAYRRCLECIPDYRYGTNNLGWALLKAGKYEEAVEVLRRAMQLEAERRHAIANLARALRKLGRYREAIDVLSEDKTQKGTVRKRSLRQIATLQELIKSTPEPKEDMHTHADAPEREQKVPPSEPDEADEGDEQEVEEAEDEQGPDIAEVRKDPAARLTPAAEAKRKRPKVALEKILESLIEEKVLRGDVIFNRKLRMYESRDGFYGRQFPIPEIGFIDLLAVDVDRGDFVVIELKRDKGTREVIGQISEYVGWVKNNLAGTGQQVVAVICLHTADKRLRVAAEAVGIEVFEYDLSFR